MCTGTERATVMAVMVLRISIRNVCPGLLACQEVAYRATGGAAQNISMADMIAIREENTIWYSLWVCTGDLVV
jgi:hypothetical protein